MSSEVCPECGANLPAGGSCNDLFDACLALEYENPSAFGAVHHLTVLAYVLQHPSKYSRQGWLEGRKLLGEFLHNRKSPAEMRTQNRGRVDNSRRTWSITKGEQVTELDGMAWSVTIVGVPLDNVEVYRAGVTRWAQAVLADIDGLAVE
jgi:hypothetical protein